MRAYKAPHKRLIVAHCNIVYDLYVHEEPRAWNTNHVLFIVTRDFTIIVAGYRVT